MARIDPPVRGELSPEQQQMFDRIAAGRGSVRGPFTVLVHDPPLAEAVMALGGVARDAAVLPPAESELAILTTASERRVAYIWSAHEPAAVRAGTRPEAIRAAQTGSDTGGLSPREAVVIDYARAIVRDSRVGDALFQRAIAELGRPAVTRLAALVGFYMLIGSVLMTFDIQPAAQPSAGAGA